jgi:hypothetical protein
VILPGIPQPKTSLAAAAANLWRRPAAWACCRPRGLAIAIAAAHLPVAFLVRQYPAAAGLHALLTVSLLFAAVALRRGAATVACLAAYTVGSEVLWRMAAAPAPWELAKYAVAVTLVWAAVMRDGRGTYRAPLFYMLLLLPALWVTDGRTGWLEFRNAVSGSLSGPMCLAACCLYFRRASLDPMALRRLLACLCVPACAVALLCVAGLLGAEHVKFGRSSSLVASGGYGPNQVSAVLGLGSLAAFLLMLNPHGARLRVAALSVSLWLTGQCALAFSRGGVYSSVIAGGVACMALARWRTERGRVVVGITAFVAVALLMVPIMNRATNGRLVGRFMSLRPTGRDQIVAGDMRLFLHHPVLGVGVGSERRRQMHAGSPQIEYTRMLGEHGLLGGLAVLVLAVMAWRGSLDPGPSYGSAVKLACLAWSLTYMLWYAMRLAAPAFMFGLALCRMQFDEAEAPAAEREAETPALTAGRHRRSRPYRSGGRQAPPPPR